jgi:two-component system KDP operon response regulator KdpE
LKVVLVRESDREILALLRIALDPNDWRIETLAEGAEPVRRLEVAQPDVALVDVDRAGGESLVGLIGGSRTVAIAVSSDSRDEREITFMAMGADAVYRKPLAPDVLAARLDAIIHCLGKHIEPGSETYRFEGLSIDLRDAMVSLQDVPVHLSSTESRILRVMALNAGRIVTYDQLLQMVWGDGYEGSYDLLRTFISGLRRHLREAGFTHEIIHTERHLGYWVPRAPSPPVTAAEVAGPAEPVREQSRILRERLKAQREQLLGSVQELQVRTRRLAKPMGIELEPNGPSRKE